MNLHLYNHLPHLYNPTQNIFSSLHFYTGKILTIAIIKPLLYEETKTPPALPAL